jgi:hypothetical protein
MFGAPPSEDAPTVVITGAEIPARLEKKRLETSRPPSHTVTVSREPRSRTTDTATLWARVSVAVFLGIAIIFFTLATGVRIGTSLARQPAQADTTTATIGTPPSQAPSLMPSGPITQTDKASPGPKATATPKPTPKATVTPKPTPKATAASPEIPPTPKPTPKATATPKTKPASDTSWKSRVDQGWRIVEREPTTAADHFKRALAVVPNNADANYGYGYAMLKIGKLADATTHLCRARAGDVSMQREVAGLLAEHELSCD